MLEFVVPGCRHCSDSLCLLGQFDNVYCTIRRPLICSSLINSCTKRASLPKPRTVLDCALARLLDGTTGLTVMKGPVVAALAEMAVRPGGARLHNAVVVGGEGVGDRIIHDDAGFRFRARRPVAAELGRIPGRVGTALEASLATGCPSFPTSEGVVLARALFLLLAETKVGHNADEVLNSIKFGSFGRIGREGIIEAILLNVLQNFVLPGNERSAGHAVVVDEAELFLASSAGMEWSCQG
mmetsp:Transcript_9343/g.15505  ORF Transcript_9343/g.15505 Transcript_9343/m.15505 type:complete len:240 (+) Transcript_9343:337-1056(+)